MGPWPSVPKNSATTGNALTRIVLDTNVLISVALPASRLQALYQCWRQGRCRLLVSPEIFDEYLRVFTYPKFKLSAEDIKRIVEQELRPYTELVNVSSHVDVIKTDRSDNKFLACALDGRADAIVSGDHHLLSLRRFRDIPILTPRQFLDQLADQPNTAR